MRRSVSHSANGYPELGQPQFTVHNGTFPGLEVAQSCPTLCKPMDYMVLGIFQARILEWVAFPFSGRSSQPRDRTQSPALQADSLPSEPPGKPVVTILYSRPPELILLAAGHLYPLISISSFPRPLSPWQPPFCSLRQWLQLS